MVHGPFSSAVLCLVWYLLVSLVVRVVTACTGLAWYILSLVIQGVVCWVWLVVIYFVTG